MTLQQLRYVVAVVEAGSFSAAAAALRLSTPSISDQVRRLEAELGVRLFARAGRTVALTDAGRDLLPHARHVLQAADHARQSITDLRDLRRGVLTFGLFRNAGYYLLADLAEGFLALHPNVQLRLLGQNSAEVAAAVRAGRVEAGLIVLPVDDEGLAIRPLLADEVLYVSADPARAARPVGAAEVAAAPLILYDAGFSSTDPTRRQLAERVQRHGLALHPRVELEYVEAAVPLVARGVGDMMVSSVVHARLSEPLGLHAVPFAEPLYDTVAVVFRRGATPSRAARRMIELAEAHLRALAIAHPRIALLAGAHP
jgi:DNA-binding transcriptional LysR family regulator